MTIFPSNVESISCSLHNLGFCRLRSESLRKKRRGKNTRQRKPKMRSCRESAIEKKDGRDIESRINYRRKFGEMCRPGVFLQNQYLIIYYKMWIPKLVDLYNDDMCLYLKASYRDTSFFLKEKMVIMTIHLPLSLHFGRAGCYYPFIYFFEAIILSFLNSLRALNFGFPLFVFFFL